MHYLGFNYGIRDSVIFPGVKSLFVEFKKWRPSEVAPEKRTRLAFGRSRVQIPWSANLVEVFSGFFNVKLTKELVIFKNKCRVGPHIPLLMI